MRVLVFGTYDTRSHPRVGILAAGLRRHGFDVSECNVPLGIDTAGRVAILKQPWKLPVLALRIVRCWVALASAARKVARPDAVLVGYLGHFDVLLARLLFRRSLIVLDHLIFAADTARDRGESGGLKLRLLRAVDRAALRVADVIVVDTEEHKQLVPARWRDRAVVTPVGASEDWFEAARPADRLRTGWLRVIFFGAFTPLQGAPVLGEALAELAGEPVEVTMVGSGQDYDQTRASASPNAGVTWLDWVQPEALPSLVAAHDVCLGVFGTTPKALNVVPNKVFQGAAAGCAIVTSDSPPQRRALGSAGVLVPPGNPAAVAAALRRLAGDERELIRMRKAAQSLARDRFTPDQIVRPLVDRLAARSTPAITPGASA